MRIYLLVPAILFVLISSVFSKEEKPFIAEAGPDGVQRVELLGGNYFFRPGHIVVRVNAPVELIVKKESTIIPHNIVIDAPEAGMDIGQIISTEPKTFRFTPVKTGIYAFYCDKRFFFLKSHRAKGMKGIIEVVE